MVHHAGWFEIKMLSKNLWSLLLIGYSLISKYSAWNANQAFRCIDQVISNCGWCDAAKFECYMLGLGNKSALQYRTGFLDQPEDFKKYCIQMQDNLEHLADFKSLNRLAVILTHSYLGVHLIQFRFLSMCHLVKAKAFK